jgi:hypothetical protein
MTMPYFDATSAVLYVAFTFALFVAPVYSLITGLHLYSATKPYFGRHSREPRPQTTRLAYMAISLGGFVAGMVGLWIVAAVGNEVSPGESEEVAWIAPLGAILWTWITQSVLLMKPLQIGFAEAFLAQTTTMTIWAAVLALGVSFILASS